MAYFRPSGTDGTSGSVVCPRCGGSVQRIRRRWIDRLLSVFGRRRRFRCHSLRCGWEGNLRALRKGG